MLVDVQTNPTGLGSQKGNILTGRLMQEVLVVGHQFQKCLDFTGRPDRFLEI